MELNCLSYIGGFEGVFDLKVIKGLGVSLGQGRVFIIDNFTSCGCSSCLDGKLAAVSVAHSSVYGEGSTLLLLCTLSGVGCY